MSHIFGYIAALLSISATVPYIRDILKKETQPERASWFIWTVLGSIAFFSQWAKGADALLWFTAGQTASVAIVFLLSLKYGVGGLTRRDIGALIAAGFGLVLWYLTDEPAFALLMVVVVDGIGAALTIIKAYEEPTSETLSTWVVSGTSAIFGTLAVGSLEPILLVYPLYLILANYGVVVAMFLSKRPQRAHS